MLDLRAVAVPISIPKPSPFPTSMPPLPSPGPNLPQTFTLLEGKGKQGNPFGSKANFIAVIKNEMFKRIQFMENEALSRPEFKNYQAYVKRVETIPGPGFIETFMFTAILRAGGKFGYLWPTWPFDVRMGYIEILSATDITDTEYTLTMFIIVTLSDGRLA
jgi:hypothetical protein